MRFLTLVDRAPAARFRVRGPGPVDYSDRGTNISPAVPTAGGKGLRRTIVHCLLAFALSACSTIRGSQGTPAELRPSTPATPVATAVENFYSPDSTKRGGLSQFAYRNLIIRQYMQRIEGDYRGFTNQLYSGDRGTALGFDLLQLGLAAATGFVKPSLVEEFATASTVTAGARASIDQRVFYDRTISALIATMDADRTQIKADIAAKRRLLPSQYALDDAFDDLNLLAEAGNINRAFGRLTQNAQEDSAAAQARLNGISAACDDITDNDAELRREFRLWLDADPANVTMALEVMGLDPPDGDDQKAFLRGEFANEYCGDAPKQDLLDKLKATEDANP